MALHKVVAYIAIPLSLISCGIRHPKPAEICIIRQIDSIVYHDSTILVDLPVERVVDVVPIYDTLFLETSLAKANAYVDTLTHSLKGSLENKEEPIKTEIKWKEKIVVRDSIVTREIPVEVKVPIEVVPWHYWLWFGIAFIAIIITLVKFLLKIKR